MQLKIGNDPILTTCWCHHADVFTQYYHIYLRVIGRNAPTDKKPGQNGSPPFQPSVLISEDESVEFNRGLGIAPSTRRGPTSSKSFGVRTGIWVRYSGPPIAPRTVILRFPNGRKRSPASSGVFGGPTGCFGSKWRHQGRR